MVDNKMPEIEFKTFKDIKIGYGQISDYIIT